MNKDKEMRQKRFQCLKELVPLYSKDLCLENAKVIKELYYPKEPRPYTSKISFEKTNVIKSMYHHDGALTLIFASAKNPGGGVERGSRAQEEEISSVTSWYFQAKECSDFYLEKRASALNSDAMLYAKTAYMFFDENYNEVSAKKVSLLAVASPNLAGMISQNQKVDEIKVYQALSFRIKNVLILAENEGYKKLILGAWGCGVFGLDPVKVARAFKEEILKGYFQGEIIFSIMGSEMHDVFKDILSV